MSSAPRKFRGVLAPCGCSHPRGARTLRCSRGVFGNTLRCSRVVFEGLRGVRRKWVRRWFLAYMRGSCAAPLKEPTGNGISELGVPPQTIFFRLECYSVAKLYGPVAGGSITSGFL